MKLIRLIALPLLLISPAITSAASINDMQTCQATLNFVVSRLAAPPENYAAAEVATIKQGLTSYDDYIQREIITPGLLKFNNNDAARASAMQEQVDAYKAKVVESYAKRYPHNQLLTDYAIAINNCTKQAMPEGAEMDALKQALLMIVKLANR